MLVEVATFRREPERADDAEELLITDDNTFVRRCRTRGGATSPSTRSSTTSADFSVIDYVGGLEDLEAKRVRVIGDPDVRFREDPVRMNARHRVCLAPRFRDRAGHLRRHPPPQERDPEGLRRRASPRRSSNCCGAAGRAARSI